MKTSIQNYFANQSAQIDNEFVNVEGFAEAAGEQVFAEGDAYTDGGKPKSDPFILVVENTTGATVSNIVLLNASTNYVTGGAVAGLSITMGIFSFTYREFLSQIQNSPFRVAQTILESTSATQVSETFSIVHRDVRGDRNDFPLIFVKDPYQNQTATVKCDKGYTVDFMTQMNISRILANTTLKIYMYPAVTFKASRSLNNAPVLSDYTNPNVVSPILRINR